MNRSRVRHSPQDSTATTGSTPGGERSGVATQLRALSFDEGAALLSPGDGAPVQLDNGGAPILTRLADPSVLLSADELVTLSYPQVVTYLDTRPKSEVERLRTDARFLSHAESLGAEAFAQVVCRILLRTPGSVVDQAGARTEAIRILSSQLRDAEVCRNLLANEAYVVIIPRNKLMTDFDEFKQWAGTYTFDGRPWDITRGMGGIKTSRNTAIAEENLLGEDVDGSTARKGWWSKEWMEASKASGNIELNEHGNVGPKSGDQGTRTLNPQVYCSGYSTTNHEFFHTIHSLGLNKTDHATIQSEYNDKRSKPNDVEWADGPRLDKAGNPSENYASSTVFEYWAQTGCAFQGTNTGDDPYTFRPRNNGRGWVEKHEPGLAALLQKVCSDSELKDVNPRDAKKAPVEEPKAPEQNVGGVGSVVAPVGDVERKPEGGADVGGTVIGDNIGFIGER